MGMRKVGAEITKVGASPTSQKVLTRLNLALVRRDRRTPGETTGKTDTGTRNEKWKLNEKP